jgi:hypothetical protein
MKNILQIIAVFLFCGQALAQPSGYLGKNNHVQVLVGAVPSFKHQSEVVSNTVTKRLKFANLNYQFIYTRVISNGFDLSLGYQYTNVNGISDGVRVDDYDTIFGELYNSPKNIMDDPELIYHSGYLALNFYRRGSLAPLGKSWGLIFGYGNATLAENTPVVIGTSGDYSTNNAFKQVAELENQKTIFLPEQKISTAFMKLRVGRSFPISDYMMIYAGVSFPLLSYYNSGNITRFGFRLDPEADIENSSDWIRYSMSTLKAYNGISLETGFRFHF